MYTNQRSEMPTKEEIYHMVRDTILNVEEVLLNLPRKGEKVEIMTMTRAQEGHTGRTTNDVVRSEKSQSTIGPAVAPSPGRAPGAPKLPLISPSASVTYSTECILPSSVGLANLPTAMEASQESASHSTMASSAGALNQKMQLQEMAKKPTKPLLNKAQLVPGSVTVRNLEDMAGVMIDVGVNVTTRSGAKRVMQMTIECPSFVPRRIKCDNQWYTIA